MSRLPDIVVTNARTRGREIVDIAITDGVITAIGSRLETGAKSVVDAGGGLVTPAYVNPHLHLCKVWTLPMMSEEALEAYQGGGMSAAAKAVDLAAVVKSGYDASWIVPNARRAVALAALHGNLHIRAFADVDTKARLEGVKALLAIREEFRGIVEIQVVAFPQDGLSRERGAEDLMRKAMALGADIVGGIPWIEANEEDMRRHVEFCFDLATEHGADVSMLLDDVGDPDMRTLDMMARAVIARGAEGRALAHHCRAMALYPETYLRELMALLGKARVSIVSNPHTGPLHARVEELLGAGINVCLGQDDISDAYYPHGRNNMLEVAFLASHLLWMTRKSERETLYDMITTRAATAINLERYGLGLGCAANLVILDQGDVTEALRFHAPPRVVISHGRVVDMERLRALAQIAPSG
ncbi:amidohydrolase family protein [Bradyrhizobium cajani]|uniref:Amidohydrolase family protein n=1 Tax=Bradyrhizobium cajani TaxID=1928661 RepID=A0A844T7L6_9BRAD|nr:amidohydrolase family protein [Bradyrhizobium cajani]MCP3371221.1 amidohydrolase family protein [Bradyrhizobium cajani]MVT72399.1 amidohydrolase family protein [Bradyrhizobium cajani]